MMKWRVGILTVCLSLLVSCGGDSPSEPGGPGAPANVNVSPSSFTATSVGATQQLTAVVSDAAGVVITNAAVSWSSSDETVATVSATGLATAVGDGSATITASSGQASGTASVTVAQAVASVTLSETSFELDVGASTELSATGADANGSTVEGATFTFAASQEGLVDLTVAGDQRSATITGVAEGTATITVASVSQPSVTAAADVTVLPPPEPFEPTANTEIGGAQSTAEVMIPAGVTVTVTEDLVLTSNASVEIAGTLTGDCVGIDLSAATSLTVTGTIDNSCAAGSSTRPDVSLVTQGALTIEDATLTAAGSVLISNDESAAAAALGTALRAAAAPNPCRFARSEFSIFDNARAGADGEPAGEDGSDGQSLHFRCSGDADFIASRVVGQGGGRGGDGTSSSDGVQAVGGKGGNGSNITVEITGNLMLGSESFSGLTLLPGEGGRGGTATATGKNPSARGGDGGHIGTPTVIVGGNVTVFGDGLVIDYHLSDAGTGGLADAVADDGASATSTTAAEKGGTATAVGGKGGSLASASTLNLIGGIIQAGSLTNPANITLLLSQQAPGGTPLESKAGRGGVARVRPGKGGDGSKEFPNGANGGDGFVTGGAGGDANILDNRGNVYVGTAGDGGQAQVLKGNGGSGASMCMLPIPGPGGTGGNGGIITGTSGAGGFRGASQEGVGGGVSLGSGLNGGNGGDGAGPGDGGSGGNDDVLVVIGASEIIEPWKEPGAAGNPCEFAYDAGISVTSDPNGHEPFVQLTSVGGLTVRFGADGAITITGSSPWVELTGTVSGDGSFSTQGRGTLAGYSGVLVTFAGTLSYDQDGNPTGISGTLTADAENAIFPPNGDGVRNPPVYSVTGTP